MATVKLGSRGQDVRDVQNALNLLGTIPPVVIDGIFGPITDGAVKRFQTKNSLTPDGVVGPATIARIKLLLGGTFPAAPSDEVIAARQTTATPAAAAQDGGGSGGLVAGIGIAALIGAAIWMLG